MKFIRNPLLAAALFAGLCPAAPGAPAFTITPAAVSNTYSGTITLQITGLAGGDTVVVQKFLDANTNGLIDGGDGMVQQFNLTDGQAGMVIGGVTNNNVPGDTDGAANGQITAKLNFPNGDFVQNIVGNYLYKLSGHFAPPVTNGFSVTNFPFPQKFTGNVVSNSSSTTLSNAIIVLFPPPRPGHKGLGQPLAGTVANNAGAYSIRMPVGTYTLVAFETNLVFNAKKAPVLTLTSGLTVNTNLTLTNATASITGQVVDAGNNAIGIPGVFLPVQSTNGLLAITFADTNGNFTARVTAGGWNLGSADSGLIVHGYVGWNNGTNVNNGAAVTLAFPKADAMFYGSIKDNLGNPMAGIDVNDYDSDNKSYSMDGYTDANGNYFVGALGLGGSDPWQLGVGGESAPTNYDFTQPSFDQNSGTNLTAGQALLVNFTGILATNTISGNVKDSNGANIAGVGVPAGATINSVDYFLYADTDPNGNYSLNVASGNWTVGIECYGGSDSLSRLGSYACPNSVNVTIANNNAVTNFAVQICGGLSISPASPLPVGEVNLFYNQSIQASDCSGNYNWSQPGGTLPHNLNLYAGGQFYTLAGNPNTSGTFVFTVQVNDGGVNMTNRQYSVSISNAVQVTTMTLPNGTNRLDYSQQLQAVNGVPFGGVPYSWSSDPLPANLNLATNGLLSGTATVNGTFNFNVQATDSIGGVATQALSLTLITTNVPPLAISTAGGQIFVLWPAAAGTNFTLETTTNLATGPWVPATNGVPQNAFSFSNSAPDVFFRLH